MSAPTEIVAVDKKGESLHIGDRVYIAPRSYGGKGDVCCLHPCFDKDGEEIKKPSIRGRVAEILWSDKHECAIIVVDQPKGGMAVIYPELAKKQAGRTQAEKTNALHAKRADKLKQIRKEEREKQNAPKLSPSGVNAKKKAARKKRKVNRK
jgi:hypothetical protein